MLRGMGRPASRCPSTCVVQVLHSLRSGTPFHDAALLWRECCQGEQRCACLGTGACAGRAGGCAGPAWGPASHTAAHHSCHSSPPFPRAAARKDAAAGGAAQPAALRELLEPVPGRRYGWEPSMALLMAQVYQLQQELALDAPLQLEHSPQGEVVRVTVEEAKLSGAGAHSRGRPCGSWAMEQQAPRCSEQGSGRRVHAAAPACSAAWPHLRAALTGATALPCRGRSSQAAADGRHPRHRLAVCGGQPAAAARLPWRRRCAGAGEAARRAGAAGTPQPRGCAAGEAGARQSGVARQLGWLG